MSTLTIVSDRSTGRTFRCGERVAVAERGACPSSGSDRKGSRREAPRRRPRVAISRVSVCPASRHRAGIDIARRGASRVERPPFAVIEPPSEPLVVRDGEGRRRSGPAPSSRDVLRAGSRRVCRCKSGSAGSRMRPACAEVGGYDGDAVCASVDFAVTSKLPQRACGGMEPVREDTGVVGATVGRERQGRPRWRGD